MTRVTVTGAGGFIGGHLVNRLINEGCDVRAVDIKPIVEWHQVNPDAESEPLADVGDPATATAVTRHADYVYNLAADMGGMGFITNNKLECMLSVLPSTHMLVAAARAGVERFFYSSSACAYPGYRQESPDVAPLRESDAYPAMPEDGYGWEKLFTERMCHHFTEDAGLATRVARYHNVFGPHGTWTGGREKAPAAMCRKVATAVLSGESFIEVWGDGRATRTYMYIDDCVTGTRMIMDGTNDRPVNLGSNELVSVDELATMVGRIAGLHHLDIRHVDGPEGVRGRSSDNTMIEALYGWSPSIRLETGLEKTYAWVYDQVKRSRG